MSGRPCSVWRVFASTCLLAGGVVIVACSGARERVVVHETAERLNEQQLDGESRGPKREVNSPISVSLVPPVLDEKMRQAEKTKGVMAEWIRHELAADPGIKLIEPDRTQSGLMKPHAETSPEVEVSPKVSLKEAYGIDQKTGKPSKVLAVVFEATITSHIPPATYTVSEVGYAVRNHEVSKRFTNHVKQVILEKIAPVLPAH